MPKISASVIMPALNEEKSILASIDNTLAALDDLGIVGEIIVVNDGSRDGTRRLAEERKMHDDRIRIVNHERPKGIGASFWDGVDKAEADIVTMIPGDNENDPWETLRYVGLLKHVDIVIPFAYNKHVRSLLRNVLSFLYLLIINSTFMTNFKYTNSTIIYRKSVLKQLQSRSYSFFFQTDILIRAVKKGYLFAEVPYRLGSRKAGKSKLLSLTSLWKGGKDYFRLIRDVYFSRRKHRDKEDFCPDSMTLKRRSLNTRYK